MNNIFKMQENELDEVMRIWYKETLIAHGFINVGYFDTVEAVVRREYVQVADIYVYKEEKIVAFIAILEEEFIGGLFVSHSYQNLGIGTKLLNFAKSGKRQILLRTYKKNNKAREFYKRNGFVSINEKENMENGEREHIMMWRA